MGTTLFDKVWSEHVIESMPGGVDLIHIDRHLLHDLNGVGGFREMRRLGYRVRNPELTFATPDHAISSEPGRDTDPRQPAHATLPRCARSAARRHPPVRHRRGRPGHRARDRARNSASRCPARCSSAATATPARTARSARSPGASARASSCTCSRRRPSCSRSRRRMRVTIRGQAARAASRQGPDPAAHRAARHRGRHGLRGRVCGRGDPRPGRGGAA